MLAVDWRPLWLGYAVAAAFLLVLWLIQLRTRDAGVVDFGWAASIGGLAVWSALSGPGSDLQRVVAAALGGGWGFRLASHLLFDRVLHGEEDGRYRYLRQHWGARANAHFLWFFQAQAVLAAVLAIPFFLIAHIEAAALGVLQGVGLGVCAVALVGETVADRQLARFRRDPTTRGTTCRVGLWRYSRHPNYFFEWLMWVGFALVALPAPHGEWMVLLPVVMFVFLTRLTGIPYTEAQALRSRSDYREYQRTTSAFFPLPPSE
ncbi:MAG: DUF1295 domain-containing protein [Planctomycetes bacterium]|nr:DUF1295 domain-containing protein [Planctomycetota bacterium]